MATMDAVKKVIAWRRAGGPEIANLFALANRLQVPVDNLPIWTDAKQRFLSDTKLADDVLKAGGQLPAEEQARVINAYLNYIATVFSTTVTKQEDLLAVGKARMLFLENFDIDIPLIGDVYKEAKKVPDTLPGASAFERLKGYVERNKANKVRAEALRNAPPPSAGQPSTAPQAPGQQAPAPQTNVLAPTSPDTGMGGKIAVAAAVLVGGFIIWKFFARSAQ